MNWYAVWSGTVSTFIGLAVLATADPTGDLWRKARAERDGYKAAYLYYRSVAEHNTNLLVACAKGNPLSFPGVLVFCDPQQAPVATAVATAVAWSDK